MKKYRNLQQALIFVISIFTFNSVCFAQNPAGEKAPETLLSLLIKGGPVMIPLLICSIVALTVIIERFISLKKQKIIPTGFAVELKEKLRDCTPEDLNNTVAFCDSHMSPMARIIKAGISRCKSERRVAEIEETLEDVAGREIRTLKGSLQGLKIIAAISPLLGLLGTVYGMINAFQTVANATAGVAKAERLAAGIYEAMVTTATGLTIAIPVLLIYYFLSYRIDRNMSEFELICDDFIDVYIDNQRKTNLEKK